MADEYSVRVNEYRAKTTQEMLLEAAVIRSLDISSPSNTSNSSEPVIEREDLIARVTVWYNKYAPLLRGTPESEYILALAIHYQIIPREQVEKWSEPIEKYNFRAQLLNNLEHYAIFYKGQLLTYWRDNRRLNDIGKKGYEDITLALVNDDFDLKKPVDPTVLDNLHRRTIEIIKMRDGLETIKKRMAHYKDLDLSRYLTKDELQ